MHVLLDARLIHRKTSGMERVQRNLLRALSRRAEVTQLSALVEAGEEAARSLPDGVRLHEVATTEDALAALLPEDRAERPDVYHLTFFPDGRPRDLLLLAAARSSVVSVTDAILNRHPEYHRSEDDWAGHDRFTRALVRHADRVVSFSRSAAREAVDDLGADPDRVDVSTLAVDPGMREPLAPDEAARRREALAVGGRYVLAVGKDYPHKDLAAAVAALARLPDDVSLLVAGERVWHRPLEDGRTLDETIRRRGLADRVRWLDGTSDDDLKALLAGCAALVYPSHEEGFGLPPLEAMTLGVPVVTTDAMSIPEVTGDTAFVHAPGDVDGLVCAVEEVLEGGTAVRERVARARERATDFTWDACAVGVLASYRRAAAAGDARGDAPPRAADAMLDMLQVLARHPGRDASELAAWKARCTSIENEFRALEERYRALQAAAPRWSLRRRIGKIARALRGE